MYSLEQLYDDIKLSWQDQDNEDDYFFRAYGFLFNFCIERFVLDEKLLTIHVRYPMEIVDLESFKLENNDYRYIFILLCAKKSNDVLNALNFILLPTDYLSFNLINIDNEINTIINEIKS